MNRSLEHIAALAVILFFVPFRIKLSGIELYLGDVIGLIAIVLLFLITMRIQLFSSTLHASNFILVFIVYIFLCAVINDAPLSLALIEMLQWLSIAAFLGVLHQAGYLSSLHFLSLLALYALSGAFLTAIWHLFQPQFTDFKQLENTKYLFGFSCTLLYLMRKQIRFSQILLIVAVAMLILSQERKALLSLIIMIIVDLLFCHQKSEKPATNNHSLLIMLFLGGAVVMASLIYWLNPSTFMDRFQISSFDLVFADQTQTQWNSDLWRRLLIVNGVNLFMEHPFWGVGPKMLPEFIAPYFQSQELINYTHNFILDVAVEYGLIGITILLGGFLLATRRLFQQRIQNPISFLLAVYILAMMLFVAVNSTVMLMFLMPFYINVNNKHKPTLSDFGSSMPSTSPSKKSLIGEEDAH